MAHLGSQEVEGTSDSLQVRYVLKRWMLDIEMLGEFKREREIPSPLLY
jgi:hypothetical protein